MSGGCTLLYKLFFTTFTRSLFYIFGNSKINSKIHVANFYHVHSSSYVLLHYLAEMPEVELEVEESFLKTKCGQSFILKKEGSKITAEIFLQNLRLFGCIDKTVRESHKLCDQVIITSTFCCLNYFSRLGSSNGLNMNISTVSHACIINFIPFVA